jgi:hypothetical protein
MTDLVRICGNRPARHETLVSPISHPR